MKLPEYEAIIFYAKENPVKTKLLPWHQLFASDNSISSYPSLNFINFQNDYYYDIKPHIKDNPDQQDIKSGLNEARRIRTKKKSKQEITAQINHLQVKLKNYQNNNSIHHQELKLAIERQIKYLKDVEDNYNNYIK